MLFAVIEPALQVAEESLEEHHPVAWSAKNFVGGTDQPRFGVKGLTDYVVDQLLRVNIVAA